MADLPMSSGGHFLTQNGFKEASALSHEVFIPGGRLGSQTGWARDHPVVIQEHKRFSYPGLHTACVLMIDTGRLQGMS